MPKFTVFRHWSKWDEFGFLVTHHEDVKFVNDYYEGERPEAVLIEQIMFYDPFQNTSNPRRGELLGDYRRRRYLPGADTGLAHRVAWIDCAWRTLPDKS